jgi:hypothetical protein
LVDEVVVDEVVADVLPLTARGADH